MTGIVRGWVEVRRDGLYTLYPEDCPAAGEHRADKPMCFNTLPDGSAYCCPYWHTTTSPSNNAERLHPSALHKRAMSLGARTVSCMVVCHAAKRNRPPGC